MYNIAVIDDDAVCAKQLVGFAERYFGKVQTATYGSGAEFLASYRAQFDFILLDIEMPETDGMETARRLRRTDRRVPIIFVTRAAKYAVASYEVEAMDYILKPLSYAAFAAKMDRIVRRLSANADRKVELLSGPEVRWVAASDIRYVEVYDHYLVYHTKDGDFRMFGTLRDVEDALRPYAFRPTGRSYLVNLRYVTGAGKNSVTLSGGEEIPLSKYKRKEFIRELAAWLGRSGGGV